MKNLKVSLRFMGVFIKLLTGQINSDCRVHNLKYNNIIILLPNFIIKTASFNNGLQGSNWELFSFMKGDYYLAAGVEIFPFLMAAFLTYQFKIVV